MTRPVYNSPFNIIGNFRDQITRLSVQRINFVPVRQNTDSSHREPSYGRCLPLSPNYREQPETRIQHYSVRSTYPICRHNQQPPLLPLQIIIPSLAFNHRHHLYTGAPIKNLYLHRHSGKGILFVPAPRFNFTH
jgi:hypothetical protein